jgi:hypothetical protein
MPFDGEPRHGDYAAYIDKLVNRGVGPPGEQRMMQPDSSALKAAFGVSDRHSDALSPGQQYSAGTGIASAPTAPAPPSAHLPPGISEPASQATLAARSKTASGSMIQAGLGVVFLLMAGSNVVSAFQRDDLLQPGTIARIVVMLVLARFLLKRGLGRLRNTQNVPLSALPPFVPARRDKQ